MLRCANGSDFAQWAGELKARGKCGRVIVVAIMRKLLHVVHGVLTSDEVYDPRKAFPTHAHSTGLEAPMPTEQEHVASARKEFMHHQTTQKTLFTACLHMPAARPPHACRATSEGRISFLCPVSFCQQTSTNRYDFPEDLKHRQKPLTMKTVSTRPGTIASDLW
jgi:hypothetical protein